MENKKSAWIASGPVEDQPDPTRLYEQSMRNVLLARQHKIASGKSAWSELNRAAFGDGKGVDPRKLTRHDASVLASNLFAFLNECKPRLKQLGVSKGEVCRRAGLTPSKTRKLPEDAKPLSRLTLRPDPTDARKRDIYVGPEKYVALIDVVTKALGDNVELVADRLLRGTSLHRFSKSPVEWSDLEKVQARLQAIVDDLDRDFDLSTTYRRTAGLKSRWITEGGHMGWPLYDLSLYTDFNGSSSTEEIECYRAECAAAADLNQAYYHRNEYVGRRIQWGGWWLFGFESNALLSDKFFFIPHAPLGHVLMWDLPDRRSDRARYDVAVKKQVAYKHQLVDPKDDWDEAQGRPIGQTESGIHDRHLQEHFWLLAYPHPASNALVPTLYVPGEEGGAYMLPLDTDALDMLSNAVWVSRTRECNVIDWLKATLIDIGADGLDPIERNLRRTAPWLLHNPILRRQSELEESSRRLDQVFRAEGRPVARPPIEQAVDRKRT